MAIVDDIKRASGPSIEAFVIVLFDLRRIAPLMRAYSI